MREEKTKSPSQKNKRKQTKSWFWPAIYSGIAIVFVGMIWGYTALIKDAPGQTASATGPDSGEVVVHVNSSKESFTYPLSEELLSSFPILQYYYAIEAA